MTPKPSVLLVALLGLTQICGYGSIYYSFSIVAGDVAKDFGETASWFFFILSMAFITGGVVMPFAGRLFDRFGSAKLMTAGSLLVGIFVLLTASTHHPWSFALGMCLVQVFSGLVLYDAAFTTIVQAGVGGSQNMIMFLTLIAGLASTLFWPLTTALNQLMGWRLTFVFFSGLNLFVCFPVHYWLSRRFARPVAVHVPHAIPKIDEHAATLKALDPATSRRLMIMVTAGFAISGVTLSAILSQMVPMLQALGMGSMSLVVSTLFGPSQVAMRGIQIFFGKYSTPLAMTLVALVFLPLGLAILAVSAPSLTGAIIFAVLVGLASGLKSIVQGTLPLAVFGRRGYGSRVGIMSGARYVAAALAPFAFSWFSEFTTTRISALTFAVIGVVGLLCFIDVIIVMRRQAVATV